MGNETGYRQEAATDAYNLLPAKYKRMLGVRQVQDMLTLGGATLEVYAVQGVGVPYGDAVERIVGVFSKGDKVVCVAGNGQSFRPMKKPFTATTQPIERLENVTISAERERRMVQPLGGPFC